MSMTIHLYNTLTKKIEPFKPIDEKSVRIYTCGPTVYNYAHIGNLRSFLFADMLQRTLRIVGGYDVKWIMNITDVDDKTIAGSAINSQSWRQEMKMQTDNPNENLRLYTQFFMHAFLQDMKAIGINLKDLDAMPCATDYITEMQNLIRRIFESGLAYISDGSVYFSLSEWRKNAKYGRLFAIDVENFQQGARIDADEYDRENISDFALWKSRKDNEPFWNFELNNQQLPGRPGWHIECSAMGQALLGLPFDIHTGGIDLRFPHHEDEIAQSMAGYGCETANFWCHNEFLEVEGQKMSKRYNNFFTISDLINRGIDPLDIRLAMLSAQYNSVLNFTFFGVESSAKARKRLQEFIYDLHEIPAGNSTKKANAKDFRRLVYEALADNLHAPKALERIFSFVNETKATDLDAQSRKEVLDVLRSINDIFAVWTIEPRPTAIIPSDVQELCERRWQAKKDRNYAVADELRRQITTAGFAMLDGRESYTVEKL